MTFYKFQINFVTALAQMLTKFRKIVGWLPTGGGKTVVFSGISKRYLEKANAGAPIGSGKRVLILVHRKELLQQTRRTAFNAFGINCQPVIAGMKFIPDAEVYVAMIETAHRRLSMFKNIGLVIIDECHIASFNKVIDHFNEQLIIGFSATPLSSSKKRPMKMFYDEIVCGPKISELIKDGFLCQNITWAPKDTVDRLEIAVKGDEFDENAMANLFSKTKYVHNTVAAYEKWAKGTKTLIFNVNIFHSEEVAKAFIYSGYNCKHLDSNTPAHERTHIIHWFKTTPDAILCNVGITTTGFDEPTVETVMVNKATLSMPLWIQMGGRGSRPTGEKSAFNIIDMGGNAVFHGDWNQDRDWYDLFHNPPKAGKPTAAPVKSCPQCDAIIPASSRSCIYCGYIYPAKDADIEAELGDFVVVTKGIDVQDIIKRHENKKKYYSFFQLGATVAWNAKKTIPKMQNEYFSFIQDKYFTLAREWCKTNKKRFNQWHQETATQHLIEQLKNQFPEWLPSQEILSHITNVQIA